MMIKYIKTRLYQLCGLYLDDSWWYLRWCFWIPFASDQLNDVILWYFEYEWRGCVCVCLTFSSVPPVFKRQGCSGHHLCVQDVRRGCKGLASQQTEVIQSVCVSVYLCVRTDRTDRTDSGVRRWCYSPVVLLSLVALDMCDIYLLCMWSKGRRRVDSQSEVKQNFWRADFTYQIVAAAGAVQQTHTLHVRLSM